MQVTLPADLQEFVDLQVRQGAYRTPAEVVVDGLRILAETARRDAAELEELRVAVRAGVADADAGRIEDGEKAFARLLARYDRPDGA